MLIQKIKLINFKRFSDESFDTDAGITLLVGPNSSGKSSFIKAILGLKQTVSRNNESEVWAAQGDYVDLGVYENYIHLKDKSRQFTIEVEISSINRYHFAGDGRTNISFEYGFDAKTEQAKLNEIIIEISIDSKDYDTPLIGHIFLSKQKTRNNYSLEFVGDKRILRRENDLAFKKIVLKHHERWEFHPVDDDDYSHPIFSAFVSCIFALTRSLDSDLYYLGPLRKSPARSYARTSHKWAVGVSGEYTPSVLANFEKAAAQERVKNGQYKYSYEKFQHWLRVLFNEKLIAAKSYKDVVKLAVEGKGTSTYKSSEKFDAIIDVGFGYSQVLPILLQIAVMPEGATLIIEQPELHLHPKAQAQLAEIIVDAVRDGKRFIIETHSEHLIKGFLLQISNNAVDANVGIGPNQFNTYYVDHAPSDVKRIPVNKFGEFTEDWPSGFFDESYNLSMKMLMNKAKLVSQNNTADDLGSADWKNTGREAS